ncbi:hypothetical protein [Flammeovirga pacifica]|uniref:Uncharacterized protein n=1 Tax=Flammeovirga pacifica TaxID=915059 RepID=A0A1S1YT30_FLAPC|nr:hypothetical protein [Flammeovirga pacifica]OHX64191.1 hypothetical protein NH26_21545 [Flammeovirga pacifica]
MEYIVGLIVTLFSLLAYNIIIKKYKINQLLNSEEEFNKRRNITHSHVAEHLNMLSNQDIDKAKEVFDLADRWNEKSKLAKSTKEWVICKETQNHCYFLSLLIYFKEVENEVKTYNDVEAVTAQINILEKMLNNVPVITRTDRQF